MARAPLPKGLPGAFFVLEWDRDRQTFILHTDDPNYSSYSLGSDIEGISLQFKLWGHHDVGNRTIDAAREFGAAKGSFQTGLVVRLFDRDMKPQRVKFEEEDQGHARPLPALRANS